MSNDDRRLIEDYLPIEAIRKEASGESPSGKVISRPYTYGGQGGRLTVDKRGMNQ